MSLTSYFGCLDENICKLILKTKIKQEKELKKGRENSVVVLK